MACIIDPLPSYGRERDTQGGRYTWNNRYYSITPKIDLMGFHFLGSALNFLYWVLHLILIAGDNGIIDGQGALWWTKFHKGELKYTRPYLI